MVFTWKLLEQEFGAPTRHVENIITQYIVSREGSSLHSASLHIGCVLKQVTLYCTLEDIAMNLHFITDVKFSKLL